MLVSIEANRFFSLIKIQIQMKTIIVSIVIFLFSQTGFATNLTNCPNPSNLVKTSQTDASVSYDWDDCGCENVEYRAYFEVNGQVGQTQVSSSSNMTFTGLSAGVYRFYFYSVCEGVVSHIIIDEIVIA